MKRPIYVILITLMALGLGACGKQKKSESIRSGRCARGACENGNNSANGGNTTGDNAQTQATGDTQWGQITKGPGTQQQFYDGLQGFVSAAINPYANPSELGNVSGDANQGTGVWFWGDVHTSTGAVFNANAAQNLQLNLKSAELRIVVWDDYAGKEDANGNVIPEYPVHIIGAAQGSVNGNKVDIRFEDSYGWVTLSGTYDKDYFTGTASYDNATFWDRKTHDGVKGRAGVLGSFQVPTCGFFHCQ